MQSHKKRALSALLVLLLTLSLFLPGCARETPDEAHTYIRKNLDIPKPITLRVMIDANLYVNGRDHIAALVEEFQTVYDNVTLEVEYLPLPGDEKYGRIWEEKRAEILSEETDLIEAGSGPDIFILWGPSQYEDRFFPDVNIAMREGCFADLNEYYMTDVELNREELFDDVMEAGVVNGARYLLPLDFYYKVAFVDMNRLHDAGLDSSICDSGAAGLLEAVNRLGDPQVAAALGSVTSPASFTDHFSHVLDYDTGEVTLRVEELAEYLELAQEYNALRAGTPSAGGSLLSYYEGTHWWQQGYCMAIGTAEDAIPEAASAKALGVDLKMFPITGTDGKLVAEIANYGAVSANCQYPEVAYEFLRMLLLPEMMSDFQAISRTPVRLTNHVSSWYESYYDAMSGEISRRHAKEGEGNADREDRIATLTEIEVTEEDLPILQTTVDVARILPWELKEELSNVVAQLNDPETGEATDVDIEALAQGYIDYLTVYLNGQLGAE